MIIDLRRPLPPDYPMPDEPNEAAASNGLDHEEGYPWIGIWLVICLIGWVVFGVILYKWLAAA